MVREDVVASLVEFRFELCWSVEVVVVVVVVVADCREFITLALKMGTVRGENQPHVAFLGMLII